MRLSEILRKPTSFTPPSIPDLRYIRTAAKAVRDRWPELAVTDDPKEREQLAQRLKDRVAGGDWTDVPLHVVNAEAVVVFDSERRDRPDLADAREFLYQQTRLSRSERFLRDMLMVYLRSFDPGAAHSRRLCESLALTQERMGAPERSLLTEFKALLDPVHGPSEIADRMSKMDVPFQELCDLGLRYPHDTGFMDHAHKEFCLLVRDGLVDLDRLHWFLEWVSPPGRVAREAGVRWTVGALVHPWLKSIPPEDIRAYLVESLIEMYGDPRKPVQQSGAWASVEERHMERVFSWLTREDLRFFTGVVDAAQRDPMWAPRRDFWLQLLDEGRITKSHVAFSTYATGFARRHLMREDKPMVKNRFGWQCSRDNTSLLFMLIGNKIVVEGCQNYKTHIFRIDDEMAPDLSKNGYDCEEIRLRSPESKTHSHIPSWKEWVLKTLESNIGHSTETAPYPIVTPPPNLYS